MSECLLDNRREKETHKCKKIQYIQSCKIGQQEEHLWDLEVGKEFLFFKKPEFKKKCIEDPTTQEKEYKMSRNDIWKPHIQQSTNISRVYTDPQIHK